ncbi:MAG: hypothetical protein GY745_21255 [Actinomycetia bacterium]|nr:hypothetical protein [Actinomycetes bacterium]
MTDQTSDSPTDPVSEPANFLRDPRVRKAFILSAIALAVGALVIALGIPWLVVGISLVVFGILLTFS